MKHKTQTRGLLLQLILVKTEFTIRLTEFTIRLTTEKIKNANFKDLKFMLIKNVQFSRFLSNRLFNFCSLEIHPHLEKHNKKLIFFKGFSFSFYFFPEFSSLNYFQYC